MEREICTRCGGRMMYAGREKFQLGEFGVFLGAWDNLMSGALTVDLYCCVSCRKLEFYCAELPEPGIARVPCPNCGELHEMHDARCPHCGTRLMD